MKKIVTFIIHVCDAISNDTHIWEKWVDDIWNPLAYTPYCAIRAYSNMDAGLSLSQSVSFGWLFSFMQFGISVVQDTPFHQSARLHKYISRYDASERDFTLFLSFLSTVCVVFGSFELGAPQCRRTIPCGVYEWVRERASETQWIHSSSSSSSPSHCCRSNVSLYVYFSRLIAKPIRAWVWERSTLPLSLLIVLHAPKENRCSCSCDVCIAHRKNRKSAFSLSHTINSDVCGIVVCSVSFCHCRCNTVLSVDISSQPCVHSRLNYIFRISECAEVL